MKTTSWLLSLLVMGCALASPIKQESSLDVTVKSKYTGASSVKTASDKFQELPLMQMTRLATFGVRMLRLSSRTIPKNTNILRRLLYVVSISGMAYV
jgi:hypothetical protein